MARTPRWAPSGGGSYQQFANGRIYWSKPPARTWWPAASATASATRRLGPCCR
ncbi:hypothetical protein [Propionibacterium freudenreichii]|uniref:hypothetical protein n=1 Tax=Propionibacterium freudenreichii TaxID=1744 RepID=UPI000DEEAB40